MNINWVTRGAWQAARASGYENVWGTVRYGIAVHWSAADFAGRQHNLCAAQVRGIQRYHQQNKGWADIAYNYVICPHGYVFVGRGEQSASAANGTDAGNRTYPAVCFLAGPHDPLTIMQRGTFIALRQYLMQRGVKDRVWPHLRFITTECPGPLLRKLCLDYP
jgi:N-acetylmuramoyl-L-alanine amidase